METNEHLPIANQPNNGFAAPPRLLYQTRKAVPFLSSDNITMQQEMPQLECLPWPPSAADIAARLAFVQHYLNQQSSVRSHQTCLAYMYPDLASEIRSHSSVPDDGPPGLERPKTVQISDYPEYMDEAPGAPSTTERLVCGSTISGANYPVVLAEQNQGPGSGYAPSSRTEPMMSQTYLSRPLFPAPVPEVRERLRDIFGELRNEEDIWKHSKKSQKKVLLAPLPTSNLPVYPSGGPWVPTQVSYSSTTVPKGSNALPEPTSVIGI